MSDTPERIYYAGGHAWENPTLKRDKTEYTRTDLIPAMIAKAVAEPVFQLAELQLSRQERDEAIARAALEKAAEIADEYHRRALEWAKTVRGLEQHIGETDSSRIAAAIRALANDTAALAEIVKGAK